jgi:hypothetical protein
MRWNMSKLDLFEGLKVRVFTSDRRSKLEAKDGVITDVTNRVIIVTYKDVDYRESFNIGTILSDNNIDVRVEGNWTSLKTLLLRG